MGQKRDFKKIKRILLRVKRYKEKMRQLSDQGLAHLTKEFRRRLKEGEVPDDILPEAFAAICEADRRILGMEPFDAQILGAIALHLGYLAEMNTGEGKTLAATMPLYLNALTGKSTILVTANEYLALRDAEEMGKVYRFMGLSAASGVSLDREKSFTNAEKKEIYASDIVYTTHGVLGFDYLLNHLVTTAEERFLRELYYVIIDEADSVLLDAAQMPLIISGSPRVQSNLYEMADFFVTTLTEDMDYRQEENKVWLTEEGVRHAETFFQIDNFFGKEFFEINRHVILALRAHVLYQKGQEYLVSDQGEILLIDEASGRMLKGVKLRGGQQQAIEQKEGLKLSEENRSVASITYQNLFLLFEKMAGMSGTLADAAEELRNVYGKKVLVIPPNRPVQRRDLKDCCYKDAGSQFQAAIEAALEAHRIGRPVLIVVDTIRETEIVSKILLEEKIPHNVLNAGNAFWEADIIREAGRINAVTVATSIAGRGTDIRLGENVKGIGGLAVIGISRMANTRLERQARGRAGRQGDLGSSQFFVSLEDAVAVRNGPENMKPYIEGRKRMGRRRIKRIIHKAQALEEEKAVLSRKRAMDYDQIMQRQRKLIYETRDQLLDGKVISMEKILEMAGHNIRKFMVSQSRLDQNILNRYILDHISYQLDDETTNIPLNDAKAMEKCLLQKVKKGLLRQDEKLEGRARMNEFMRIAILRAIDQAWVEQADYLQQMQTAVGGRISAQRNPVYEYHREALEAFREMEDTILKNAMRNILLSDAYIDEESKLHILFP